MSLSRSSSLIVKASLVLAVLAASPALAQTADLSVKIDTTALPGDISFGGTGDYVATIANAGPSHSGPVTLDLGAALPAGATVDSVKGCTATGADPLPCTVGDLVSGASTTVKVTIAVAVPDPLPAACPANALGSVSLKVAATAPVTDTNAANDTDTAAITVAPFAELSATLTGPGTANVGQTITYVSTVTNNGPCDSTNVEASVAGNTLLDNGFVSNTGDCTTAFPCKFAVIAPNQTVTFTTTYKVTGLAPGAMSEGKVALPQTLTAASDDIADPGDAQGTASATTVVPIASEGVGCASTGGLGLVGGLGLLLVLALRRRARA